MKIAVYGTGCVAVNLFHDPAKLESFLHNINIVYYVESNPSKKDFLCREVRSYSQIDFNDFEYLVIAAEAYDEIIAFLKEKLPDYDKVKSSILSYSEFIDKCHSCFEFDYKMVSTTEKLHYIFDANDIGVGQAMIDNGRTYSFDLIEKFFELSKSYYARPNTRKNGIFIDIGANIGTTSIYVKKKIDPDLKIIGFEPCKRNYDLLRVNCILNNTEEIECVPLGLGADDLSEKFYYHPLSPGSSRIGIDTDIPDLVYSEDVRITTLDNYLKNNSIDANDIDCIWIDVEGYESEVIKGAMNTLTKRKIPLIQEFNPSKYTNWDEYENNIRRIYNNFIVIDENNNVNNEADRIYSVDRLKEYAESMETNGTLWADLFFF